MQNLIFGPALFYDIPEYLQIVSSHTFWQSITLGHFPIHPVFLAIIWVLIKIIPVNTIAMLFGFISIFIFYKISKSVLPTIIFALFPAVWLINTNLMVESITLTFFLASIYFFVNKDRSWFFSSLFLMIGAHLESIVWIPVIFLLPYLFEKETKIDKKTILDFVKITAIFIFLAAIFYVSIYLISGRIPGGITEQLSAYISSGPLRMIRNLWLSFVTDFGTLTPFLFIILLFKNIKSKKTWLAWFIFLSLIALVGFNWQGDFMGRRIIFAAPVLALAIYKYLNKKSIFVIIYLLPIIISNIFLYSNGNSFTLPDIPTGEVLIETHYLKPFTKYQGTILWVGESDLSKINDYLTGGKRVFLTRQAVTAPYMLSVGQNYHITSLGKVGDSESRFLFQKYAVENYNGVLELKRYSGKISDKAGEPIIDYNQNFWGRLLRRRIDYGDVGTWILAISTNHRDPTDWTYIDVRGI